jgi:hypothetical protein
MKEEEYGDGLRSDRKVIVIAPPVALGRGAEVVQIGLEDCLTAVGLGSGASSRMTGANAGRLEFALKTNLFNLGVVVVSPRFDVARGRPLAVAQVKTGSVRSVYDCDFEVCHFTLL